MGQASQTRSREDSQQGGSNGNSLFYIYLTSKNLDKYLRTSGTIHEAIDFCITKLCRDDNTTSLSFTALSGIVFSPQEKDVKSEALNQVGPLIRFLNLPQLAKAVLSFHLEIDDGQIPDAFARYSLFFMCVFEHLKVQSNLSNQFWKVSGLSVKLTATSKKMLEDRIAEGKVGAPPLP